MFYDCNAHSHIVVKVNLDAFILFANFGDDFWLNATPVIVFAEIRPRFYGQPYKIAPTSKI